MALLHFLTPDIYNLTRHPRIQYSFWVPQLLVRSAYWRFGTPPHSKTPSQFMVTPCTIMAPWLHSGILGTYGVRTVSKQCCLCTIYCRSHSPHQLPVARCTAGNCRLRLPSESLKYSVLLSGQNRLTLPLQLGRPANTLAGYHEKDGLTWGQRLTRSWLGPSRSLLWNHTLHGN